MSHAAKVRRALGAVVSLPSVDTAELRLESLELIEIVAQLEAQCGLTIRPSEITPAHFATIAAIDAFVSRKQAANETPKVDTQVLTADRGFDRPFERETLSTLCAIMTDEAELAAQVQKLYDDAHIVDLKRGEYYPELLRGKLGLRNAVAAALRMPAEQVLPNFGSNGSIDTIFTAAKLTETSDESGVLMTSPTYFRNYDSAASRRLQIHEVPLRADHHFDVAAYIAQMYRLRPRVAVIVTPNNPTGIALSDEDLLAVLDAVPQGTWAMVDRTLVNTRPEISTPALLERYRERDLVVLHSFSKYKSMSQHRIGVALFSNSRFAQIVEPLLPLGLSLEACVKATRLVAADGGLFPNADVAENIQASAVLLESFVAAHPRFGVTDFSGNYCLLTLPPELGAAEVSRRLAEDGVYVMGGHEFPRPNLRVLRLHTGGPVAQLQRFCALMAQFSA